MRAASPELTPDVGGDETATTAPLAVVDQYVTDKRNAERFRTQFGDVVRFVSSWERFFYWGQTHWRRNDTRQVERFGMQTIESLWQERLLLPGGEAKKEFTKNVLKAESAGRLQAMLNYASSLEPIIATPELFDADPWLFNTATRTLNLRDPGGDLDAAVRLLARPHRREDYITKLSPVMFDPDAKAPTFMAMLTRILGGRQELIRFVQRAIGYTLTGHTWEHVLFLLLGTGANGKTTLVETFRAMLGDYAQQADFSSFLAKDTDGVRNDLARLVGARLVCAVEVEQGRRFDEAIVKQLTGGDVVAARFLFCEFFEYTPAFKIWLAANHRPQVRGTDKGIWRRLRLLPFDVIIPDAEQDKGLVGKLKAELPGILRWAVEGCLLWQREGLGSCEEVTKATDDYREDQDALGPFLSERCVLRKDLSTPTGVLHADYRSWCECGGEKAVSLRAFGEMLTERGFGRDKDTLGRKVRTGIGLRSPDTPDTSGPFPGK